jgi:hypothetical protein
MTPRDLAAASLRQQAKNCLRTANVQIGLGGRDRAGGGCVGVAQRRLNGVTGSQAGRQRAQKGVAGPVAGDQLRGLAFLRHVRLSFAREKGLALSRGVKRLLAGRWRWMIERVSPRIIIGLEDHVSRQKLGLLMALLGLVVLLAWLASSEGLAWWHLLGLAASVGLLVLIWRSPGIRQPSKPPP